MIGKRRLRVRRGRDRRGGKNRRGKRRIGRRKSIRFGRRGIEQKIGDGKEGLEGKRR